MKQGELFHDKTLSKGFYNNTMMGIYDNYTANLTLNGENLDSFHPR
jgi:hypothetical protein